jgi:hypothetical protein
VEALVTGDRNRDRRDRTEKRQDMTEKERTEEGGKGRVVHTSGYTATLYYNYSVSIIECSLLHLTLPHLTSSHLTLQSHIVYYRREQCSAV